MAVLNFQKTQDIVIFDNGDDPFVAKFKVQNNGELQYLVLFFYIQGQPNGQLRVNLLSALNQSTPIASSSWVSVSDIRSDTTNRLTWVRFDFDRIPMSTGTYFYAQLESSGYTRNGNTDFISYVQQQNDEPNINLNSVNWDSSSKPATMRIYLRS